MSNMTNEEYRKSRGTDKPFNGSEEKAEAFWKQFSREKRPQYGRQNSKTESTPKK